MADAAACAQDFSVSLSVEVGGGREFLGSGAAILHGPRCTWVLTCAHVVVRIGVRVTVRHGVRRLKSTGVVERVDHRRDLAIVKVFRKLPCPVAAIADEEPDVGDDVLLCGFPGQEVLTLSRATLSVPDRDRCRFVGGLTLAGMSGGAVLDSEGELVSVVLERHNDGPLPIYGHGRGARLADVKAFLRRRS